MQQSQFIPLAQSLEGYGNYKAGTRADAMPSRKTG